MATVQRVEKTQDMAPRIRARGHLALVEWERAEHIPEMAASEVAASKAAAPVRRTSADRFFESGLLLLMAATAFAVIASFAHL